MRQYVDGSLLPLWLSKLGKSAIYTGAEMLIFEQVHSSELWRAGYAQLSGEIVFLIWPRVAMLTFGKVVLYSDLGITGALAIALLGIYTTWSATCNFINSLLVDRIGRVRMLTIGLVSFRCNRDVVVRIDANTE